MADNYKSIFNSFNISGKDRNLYESIIAEATTFDEVESVINHFMEHYVVKMDKQFQGLVLDTLNTSLSNVLMQRQLIQLENTFMFGSSSYEQVCQANYKIVAELVAGKAVQIVGGNKFITKQLQDKLINEFNSRIQGAMANTRAEVLQHVRTLQREMIVRNRQLMLMQDQGVMESIIEKEKAMFRENMLKKFPRLEKMLENGQILRSRTYLGADGTARFKSYTLDEYTEMATSETLKNIDRDAVEFTAKNMNEPVVVFYLRDQRHVEDPNEACAHIINYKLWGVPLLATSEYVAKLLKIWSVDRAKAEHSLEISRHCRHSIRRASDEIINKVNKLIAIAGITDQPEEVVNA